MAAGAPSHNRVDLSWNAASDNVGIAGYEVLRDGEIIATLGAVTGYADTGVEAETRYEYTVKALDPSGNRSSTSNAATVTTPAAPDTQAPTAPTGLEARPISPRRVDLSWAAATDNRGVTNYEILRDGQLLATTGDVTSYSDTTVSAQTTYEYAVRALDAAANRSPVEQRRAGHHAGSADCHAHVLADGRRAGGPGESVRELRDLQHASGAGRKDRPGELPAVPAGGHRRPRREREAAAHRDRGRDD